MGSLAEPLEGAVPVDMVSGGNLVRSLEQEPLELFNPVNAQNCERHTKLLKL
jgi:hypothetical protein